MPDGVLNVVTGRGSVIGDALVGHPDVRRIAFTGSTEVGRHVMAIAGADAQARHARARRLGPGDRLRGRRRRRRGQGGDHRPLLERRARRAWAASACSSHDSVYDDFVGQLVERVGRYEPGDGTVKAEKPRLRMGPIHTRAGRDELVDADRGRRRARAASCSSAAAPAGTTRAASSSPRSSPSRATTRGSCTEEVFGPVLPVFRYTRLRRRDPPRQRHAVRPGLVDLDARRAQDPPRGAGDRRRHDVGQPDPLRLRRAAVRRRQGLGLRQGARARGARQLRRAQVASSSEGWPDGRSRSRAEGAVGTITLDNPPANSYDIEFMRELADAIDEANGADARARRRRAQREREVLLRGRRHQARSSPTTSTRTWR